MEQSCERQKTNAETAETQTHPAHSTEIILKREEGAHAASTSGDRSVDVVTHEAGHQLDAPASVFDKVTDHLAFITTMGTKLARSGFASVEKIDQAEVIVLECMIRKISFLEFVQTYHIVNGKVTMRADAMLAKFMSPPINGQVKWIQWDDEAAEAEFIVNGHSTTISYTNKDAAKAGLINRKGAWDQHRPEMLRARLISRAVRMLAPSACAGVYTPEEIQSIPNQTQKQPLFTKQS